MNSTLDKTLIFEMHFQNNFISDSVTCKINECLIFKDLELNSDPIDGLTGVILQVNEFKNKLYVNLMDQEIKCDLYLNKSKFDIEVVINENSDIFSVNIEKGKYIGLNKNEKGKIVIEQSTIPFEYD